MRQQSMKSITLGLTALALILTTTACETHKNKRILEKDGHYWQRVETTSAIYLRGPKAQQTLNKNISQCVVEVKELERLGAIQKAMPGKSKSDKAREKLSEFETPDRIGFQRREYLEYNDFESCMTAKGWERIKFVPYDVADRALDTFQRTHSAFKKSPDASPQSRGDFNNFND